MKMLTLMVCNTCLLSFHLLFPVHSLRFGYELTLFGVLAENNPANDYPDEEISSDDDDDDDEFDFDDSASEDGGDGYMSRWRGPVDSDDEY